jgi:hypothetical protein
MDTTDISLLSNEFKYIKVTSDGISVADDNKPQDFTTAIKLTRTKIIFNKLFRIFFCDQSIEDFINKAVIDFLSAWFDFDTTTGTLKIKGHVIVEQDLTVEGKLNAVSETYFGNNITVSGEANFQGDSRSKGSLVGTE